LPEDKTAGNAHLKIILNSSSFYARALEHENQRHIGDYFVKWFGSIKSIVRTTKWIIGLL